MSNAADWRKPKRKLLQPFFQILFRRPLGDSRDSLIDSLTDSVGFSNSPMLAHVGTVLKLIEILEATGIAVRVALAWRRNMLGDSVESIGILWDALHGFLG